MMVQLPVIAYVASRCLTAQLRVWLDVYKGDASRPFCQSPPLPFNVDDATSTRSLPLPPTHQISPASAILLVTQPRHQIQTLRQSSHQMDHFPSIKPVTDSGLLPFDTNTNFDDFFPLNCSDTHSIVMKENQESNSPYFKDCEVSVIHTSERSVSFATTLGLTH